jgi:hypothetical protein
MFKLLKVILVGLCFKNELTGILLKQTTSRLFLYETTYSQTFKVKSQTMSKENHILCILT